MTEYQSETDAYELALQIIERWGSRVSADECAEIAHKGLVGDVSWLLAWEEPAE